MRSSLARKVHWTEEYLTFEAGSETKHEYMDGEIYAMGGSGRARDALQPANGARLTLS